jgi:3-hydroxyisobutyrate dehydrogenase
MSCNGVTTGVVGLGEIGSGVAQGVLRAGLPLVVCDLRPEALEPFSGRAEVAADAAALGAAVDVLVVAVVDDDQARAVLTGPAGALTTLDPGSTVVVVSTLSPAAVRELAGGAAARGVDLLDCGVSGGPVAAAHGELVAMIGGEAAAVERVRPVLDAFSCRVFHMGPAGTGLAAKLARNLVQYASWLAAYEAQVLAEAAGVPLVELGQAIAESDKRIGGSSRLMYDTTVAPLPSDADPGLRGLLANGATLAHKDLQAALALGAELGVALPLAQMTEARADAVFRLAPDPARPAP